MLSPLTGLMAYSPVKIPSLRLSPDIRRLLLILATFSTKAVTSFSLGVPLTNFATNGCSGARTTYVAPKIVSGLVVKTGKRSLVFLISKKISTPKLLPIQLACMATTRAGQSCNFFKSSRSSSLYWVIFKYHWSKSFCTTVVLHRQQVSLMTSSLARVVSQLGHQLTDEAFLYASFSSSI